MFRRRKTVEERIADIDEVYMKLMASCYQFVALKNLYEDTYERLRRAKDQRNPLFTYTLKMRYDTVSGVMMQWSEYIHMANHKLERMKVQLHVKTGVWWRSPRARMLRR